LCCTFLHLGLTPSSKNFGQNNISESTRNNKKLSKKEDSTESLSTDSSSIIRISVGPNQSSPAILIIATESGNIFFRALPDFIKWEKQRFCAELVLLLIHINKFFLFYCRTPSALAQFAAVPIQVFFIIILSSNEMKFRSYVYTVGS
jgi:hypothetical protein